MQEKAAFVHRLNGYAMHNFNPPLPALSQLYCSNAMTPELCGAFCNSLRLPFFAVHRSDWCRCGVIPRIAGTAIREPAWAEDAETHLEIDEPDTTASALPLPGAYVGDPNFQCVYACGGNSSMQGCGADKAWDMYSVTTPCVLFRNCNVFDDDDGGDARHQ